MRNSTVPGDLPLIVGRQRERGALQERLEHALEGHGVLVSIGGEAGIGKTTLALDLLAEGATRDALILTGRCYDMDATPPYWVWREVLRSYPPSGNLPQPPAIFTDPVELDKLSGPEGLRSVLYDFLRDVSREQPAVLLLEDLHWADYASLDLLYYLIHHLEPLALLLVITYRDVEIVPARPLYRFLPMLVRGGRPLRLDLRPLDAGAVRELVEKRYATLPAHDIERLAAYLERYAEGNPFFIEELLGLLEYERTLWLAGDGWQLSELPAYPVPPLVRQVVEGRLERLSTASRGLLEIAAVLGMEFPLDLWQQISGATDEQLAGAIEEGIDAQSLEQTAETGLLRFRHALIHEVIYSSLNLLRRRGWHRRTAESLAALPHPDPNAVAHHFSQADDPRAADWLIQAAHRAALAFAFQTAMANYARALAILEQDEERLAERVWLLCALAEGNRFTDIERALAYANQAVELTARLADRAMEALARWCHARIRGFHDENVLDDLRQAAAAYAELSEPERERILQTSLRYVVSDATLSQELANYGQFAEAQEYARRFLAGSPVPRSRAQLIEFGNAHFGQALADAALGAPEHARTAFERARGYYGGTDNHQMISNCCYWELSTVLQVYATDQPRERARLRQAEVDANLRSEVLRAPDARALVSTSETMILDGYWEECRRSAGARLHIPASRVPSARKLAELDWRQGQRMQAWAHVLSVLPAGPDEPPGKRFFPHRQEVQWIAAELALDEGNYPLARRWIEAYERWLAWSGKASGKPTAHLLRARYHARQAELAEALHHAELALELAGEPRQPLALLAAQRALAELESAAGRPQAAETHAQAALALAEACGAPYELALTQVVHAALLLDGGAVEQARAALDAAQPTAARLEAQPLLERINALLEQLTARPAGADQIPGGLSRRELEVLQLAARGLTDAEIAGALFISPRTVGGHLHSIYGKLGVSSRTAATRFAFDHGLS